jgi:N,N'-diacetyllegionaminate synthase
MKTLVIAEAGVNHNGDPEKARALVDVAAEAGADFVKFQTFSADKLVAANAPKAEYQKQATGAEESQHEMIRKLELTHSMHDDLIAHCAKRGIRFFSTAFDLDSLDYLAGLGLDRFKVPSGEITNLPYLRRMGGYGRPVILSTGMSNMQEIGEALGVLEGAGMKRRDITVLHCNTEYPTPMRDVNLRAMLSIRDHFGVDVGYSDHTPGIEVSLAAVALGATVIEKHFTLDKNLPGPDHLASLEPDELHALVKGIRNVEEAVAGDAVKRPSPSETRNIVVARRSIVAEKAIAAGEILGAHNLTTKRPGNGLSPMRWDLVVGTRAKRAFAPDEPIES